MGRTVSIGGQDFAELVSQGDFYVDKTDLIKEWWENRDTVTLIARPRRFGKTLNMSMLNYFFSNRYADGGKIFEGLKIWESEKYHELQGTYPVINLSFSSVKQATYKETMVLIKEIIAGIYEEHRFLLRENLLSETEKEYFNNIAGGNLEDVRYVNSLNSLSKFLYRYYDKKVIILLDEYDAPLQEAYVNGFWDEMSDFIRGFFNSTLKANQYLERAMLTGITRVSKESMFSDLNNLEIATISSKKYCDKFGFTVEEVRNILAEYDLTDQTDEVRHWYDGFIFGQNTIIYNPWSIINYIDKQEFQTYWVNTSSNSLVGKLMRTGNRHVKKNLADLLNGKEIETKIDEEIVFKQLDTNSEAVWSLLLATGYLKITGRDEKEDKPKKRLYKLKITNYETIQMFDNMVSEWFANEENYNDFITALLQNDVKAMNVYMNRVALNMISYFDSGKKPSEKGEPERFYHGLTLGLMVDLEDKYSITSNRESGFGRYDVCMEPKSAEYPGIIIEFKVIDRPDDEDLKAAAQSALAQIEEKQYEASLRAKGITDIKKYGFAFEGKEVLILAESETGA